MLLSQHQLNKKYFLAAVVILLLVPFKFRLYPRTLHRCSRLVTGLLSLILSLFPDALTTSRCARILPGISLNTYREFSIPFNSVHFGWIITSKRFRYDENYAARKYRPHKATRLMIFRERNISHCT
jgi:hypothetical protein